MIRVQFYIELPGESRPSEKVTLRKHLKDMRMGPGQGAFRADRRPLGPRGEHSWESGREQETMTEPQGG